MVVFGKNQTAYNEIVSDILSDPVFLQTKLYCQHGMESRFGHCVRVSRISYNINVALGLDGSSSARGGLLHDFYLYDSVDIKHHLVTHPRTALHNAEKRFQLTKKEKDIILGHMWPLTIVPPRYLESYIVGLVDTLCAVTEFARLPYSLTALFISSVVTSIKTAKTAR